MTTRGKDFLELWIERNILPRSADEDQATRLADKLVADAAVEGLTVKDFGIEGDAVSFIRDLLIHVGEPGLAGD